MTYTPHELAEEFPDQAQLIADLKTTNAHFARLVDDYHEVNRAVHRAETNLKPTDDLNEEELRKQRLRLKDEIWQILKSG